MSPSLPGVRFRIVRLDLPIDPTIDARVAAEPGAAGARPSRRVNPQIGPACARRFERFFGPAVAA